MLCACSGEQFRFDEPAPRSPESLATRDFSVSGVSSRTGDLKSISSRTAGDLGSKYEDAHVDEVESTLKEALSLNYEEARALLGRIEYQKGNLDAALQLFQGIDIKVLTPRMTTAITERTRQRKPRSSKADNSLAGVMSWHSVSLLLEAILLKAKVLEELGQITEGARECQMIVDIVESALPNGMPARISQDNKMQEMFHKGLELLPKLWKDAGCLDEAIIAYRRALVKPWNLDPSRLACVQKDLASILLYGGIETGLPPQLQIWGPTTPKNNLEESILLLFVLLRKAALKEIEWDPDILDHLSFALSMCGGFEFLAHHIEQVLPGIYNRAERWYILALCYCATGQNEVALDLVRKITGHSESKNEPDIPSLLLGAKFCANDPKLAQEGINYSRKVIDLAADGNKHFMAQAHKFLGMCYSNAARTSISNSEREMYRKGSLKFLSSAASVEKDPELMFNLGLENAAQRNLDAGFSYTKQFSNMVAGSSARGWELLALIASAHQQFEDAGDIVDIALDETTSMDHLKLLRLKAVIQIAQDDPKQAIENYVLLLAQIQSTKQHKISNSSLEAMEMKHLEMVAWQDLAKLYTRLESWGDAEICVKKAKSIDFYSPQSWHAAGILLKAQSLYKEALVAFSVSLSIEPSHVPSLVSAAEIFMEFDGASLPISRSLLMNALQLEPTNFDAWLSLGLILKKEGLASQAADCFQAACELKSTAPVQPFV